MRRFALVLALTAACVDDRLQADVRPALPSGATTASPDGGGPPRDGGTDAGGPTRCRADAPFGTPRRVTDLNDKDRNEWVFRVSPDERLGLLYRQDNETGRILAFRGKDSKSPWSADKEITAPSFPKRVADPWLASLDGKPKLFFTAEPVYDSSKYELRMIGWDASKTEVVGEPETLFPSASFSEVSPTWVEVSGELWFIRNAGAYRIYKSVRTGSTFGTPELDPVLSAFEGNGALAFSPDALTVFFGAQPAGSTTDVDVYTAHRLKVSEPFTDVTRVVELSSPAYDQPTALSTDGCVVYLASTRGDGDAAPGGKDVFVAERGM